MFFLGLVVLFFVGQDACTKFKRMNYFLFQMAAMKE